MENTVVYQSSVGIDVSGEHLDLWCSHTRQAKSVPYTEQGVVELLQDVSQWQPDIIVVAATGGLERRLVLKLAQAELPTVVVNPRQVRDFAKALGRLAFARKLITVLNAMLKHNTPYHPQRVLKNT